VVFVIVSKDSHVPSLLYSFLFCSTTSIFTVYGHFIISHTTLSSYCYQHQPELRLYVTVPPTPQMFHFPLSQRRVQPVYFAYAVSLLLCLVVYSFHSIAILSINNGIMWKFAFAIFILGRGGILHAPRPPSERGMVGVTRFGSVHHPPPMKSTRSHYTPPMYQRCIAYCVVVRRCVLCYAHSFSNEYICIHNHAFLCVIKQNKYYVYMLSTLKNAELSMFCCPFACLIE